MAGVADAMRYSGGWGETPSSMFQRGVRLGKSGRYA